MAQARRLGSVVEHMAEMPAAAAAQHFGALEAERAIGPRYHRIRERAEEARPARVAVELGRRAEHGQVAPGTVEESLAMLVEQRTGEGRLGRGFAQHCKALRSEDPPPLRGA